MERSSAHLLCLLTLLVSGAVRAGGEPSPWRFRFVGLERDESLVKPELDDSQWDAVTPPDFNKELNREQRSFGVYRWHFTIPEALARKPMRFRIGRIVDLDRTYLNGILIGETRDASIGWRHQREYSAPADMVRPGDNVLAVEAYRILSEAGLLDVPSASVQLWSAAPWRWGVASADLSPQTVFEAKVLADWGSAMSDLQAGTLSEDQWLLCAVELALPEELRGQRLALQFGRPGHHFRAWLNGTPIAYFGMPPPNLVRARPKIPPVPLPPEGVRFGDEGPNRLVFKVFSPDTSEASLLKAPVDLWLDLPGAPQPFRWAQGIDPAAAADRARFFRRKGELAAARRELETIVSSGQGDTAGLRLAMGEMALIAAHGDQAEPVIRAYEANLKQDFRVSSTVEVMDAVCQAYDRSEANRALFLGEDRPRKEPGHSWPLQYGSYAYILCAYHDRLDAVGGAGWPVTHQFRTADPGFSNMLYRARPVPAKDPRALLNPIYRQRWFAWRDDYGEVNDFEDVGPDLVVDLDVAPGWFVLSLYIVDPDWSKTKHPRKFSIAVLDGCEKLLAAAKADRLGEGAYFRFLVPGGRRVTVRIYKHHSPDANLSGLFLDRGTPPTPPNLAGAGWSFGMSADCKRWAEDLAAAFANDPVGTVLAVRSGKRALDPHRLGIAGRESAKGLAYCGLDYQLARAALDPAQVRDTIARLVTKTAAGIPDVSGRELLGALAEWAAEAGDQELRLAALAKRASLPAPEAEARLDDLLALADAQMVVLQDGAALETYRKVLDAVATSDRMGEVMEMMGAETEDGVESEPKPTPPPKAVHTARWRTGLILLSRGEEAEALKQMQPVADQSDDPFLAAVAREYVRHLERKLRPKAQAKAN